MDQKGLNMVRVCIMLVDGFKFCTFCNYLSIYPSIICWPIVQMSSLTYTYQKQSSTDQIWYVHIHRLFWYMHIPRSVPRPLKPASTSIYILERTNLSLQDFRVSFNNPKIYENNLPDLFRAKFWPFPFPSIWFSAVATLFSKILEARHLPMIDLELSRVEAQARDIHSTKISADVAVSPPKDSII